MNVRPISQENPLVLASSSPRRKDLLKQICLPFLPVPSPFDERGFSAHRAIQPARLAEEKAMAVHAMYNHAWILGADTMVLAGDDVLGKPRDGDEARRMLLQLAGKEHRVITGFCLLEPSKKRAHREEIITSVTMRRLTLQEINNYIATGEPFGKAGSYAIQGIGASMVASISGSYTNVVGLPICALVKTLLTAGAIDAFPMASQ